MAGKSKNSKPGCRPYIPKGKPLRLTHKGTTILVYRERGNHFRVVAPPEVEVDKGAGEGRVTAGKNSLPPPAVR